MSEISSIEEIIESLNNMLRVEGTVKIIVDGANVLYSNRENGIKFQRILEMKNYLTNRCCEPYILIPCHIRRKFHKLEQFQDLISQNFLYLIPSGTDDDLFIIDFAREVGGYIVSNDFFKEYQTTYPIVTKKRTLRFMIVERGDKIHVLVPALAHINGVPVKEPN